MALLSKEEVWISLTAGIAGSAPVEGVDDRLLWLLCVVHVAASATS